MGWIIFFIVAALLFYLTSFKKLKHLWVSGIISIIILYIIDSTLISLEAFSYNYSYISVGNLPLLYLLSSFWGGMLLVRFYPLKGFIQFPYIILSAFLFLILELIMHYAGYFIYDNWSPINSLFLNIFGFIIVIWIWEWVKRFLNK